jgi:hypothetical protein
VKAKGIALIPFVPSGPQFELTLAFLLELGFEKTWECPEYAGLRYGAGTCILQNIDVPQWQSNQMLVIEVDDLDGYWAELETKNLPSRFAGVKLRPPTDFPWGREVHIIDPAGVCWHVRQAKSAA